MKKEVFITQENGKIVFLKPSMECSIYINTHVSIRIQFISRLPYPIRVCPEASFLYKLTLPKERRKLLSKEKYFTNMQEAYSFIDEIHKKITNEANE